MSQPDKCPGCPIAGPCVGRRPDREWACSMASRGEAGVRWLEHASAAPPPSSAAYPPLATQARGLVGSLATWLRAGCPITPATERARRRAICAGGEGHPPCDQFDPDRRRCRKCGCFGDLKPWMGTANCPRGKWDRSDAPA